MPDHLSVSYNTEISEYTLGADAHFTHPLAIHVHVQI